MLNLYRLAMRRTYFQELMPLAYAVDVVGRNGNARAQDITCNDTAIYFEVTDNSWTSFPTIMFPDDSKAKIAEKDVFIVNESKYYGRYEPQRDTGRSVWVISAVSPPDELLNEIFSSTTETINRSDGRTVTGLGVPMLQFYAKWPFQHRAYSGCHVAF